MNSDLENDEEDYFIPESLNNDLDVSNILNNEEAETYFSPENCYSINLAESIWRPKFKKDEFLDTDSDNFANKVIQHKKNLGNIIKSKLEQLKALLSEKSSKGYLLTKEEELFAKESIKDSFEKEYLDRFLRQEKVEPLSIESITKARSKDSEEYDYTGVNLRSILVSIDGKNAPNKKIVSEITKSLKRNKNDSKTFTIDNSYIRTVPGLFCLLRMFLVKHALKKNNAKLSNSNSKISSLTVPQIAERISEWQSNDEVQKLNATWIHKTSDWVVYVEAALKFLSADPAINILAERGCGPICNRPYVEFKNRTQNCTWVTSATKFNDEDDVATDERKKLARLFPEWFKFAQKHHKFLQTLLENNAFKVKNKSDPQNSRVKSAVKKTKPTQNESQVESELVTEEDIPACIHETDWVVRSSTLEEKREFQRQEAERFSKPWLSYVYRMHNYSSVVGPLRSYLRQADPVSLSSMKPRTHPLLRNDRPPIVGLADIVRDAVARLPNGEGNRSDIVTLATDSGFLIQKFDDKQLHQCISGALDRLQCEPDTPVVYRQSRRVWIYKHRHRTPEEFMQIYQTQKNIQAKKKELKRARPSDKVNGFDDEPHSGNGKIRRISEVSNHHHHPSSNNGNYEVQKRSYSKSNKNNLSSRAYMEANYNTNEDIPDIDDLLNSNDPDLESCRSNSHVGNHNSSHFDNFGTYGSISFHASNNNSQYNNNSNNAGNHHRVVEHQRSPVITHVKKMIPNNNNITSYTTTTTTKATISIQNHQHDQPSKSEPVTFKKITTITLPNAKSINKQSTTQVLIRKLTK